MGCFLVGGGVFDEIVAGEVFGELVDAREGRRKECRRTQSRRGSAFRKLCRCRTRVLWIFFAKNDDREPLVVGFPIGWLVGRGGGGGSVCEVSCVWVAGVAHVVLKVLQV